MKKLTFLFFSFFFSLFFSQENDSIKVYTKTISLPQNSQDNFSKPNYKFKFDKIYTYRHSYLMVSNKDARKDTLMIKNLKYYINDTNLSILFYLENNKYGRYTDIFSENKNHFFGFSIKDSSKKATPENFDYYLKGERSSYEIDDLRKKGKYSLKNLKLLEKKEDKNYTYYKYNLYHKGLDFGTIELIISNENIPFNNNILYDIDLRFLFNKIIFEKGKIISYKYFSSKNILEDYYEYLGEEKTNLSFEINEGNSEW